MTRRRHSTRGLTMAQTGFYDASDDLVTSKKPASDRQTRHGAAGIGANFELRAVKEVQEIFRGIVDDDVILSVLESCNYDSEKATSLLCEVTATSQSSGLKQRSVDQHDRSSQSKTLEEYYRVHASGIFCQRSASCRSFLCFVTLLKPYHNEYLLAFA